MSLIWQIVIAWGVFILAALLIGHLIYRARQREYKAKHPHRRSVEPCGPRGIVYGESERAKLKIKKLRIVHK